MPSAMVKARLAPPDGCGGAVATMTRCRPMFPLLLLLLLATAIVPASVHRALAQPTVDPSSLRQRPSASGAPGPRILVYQRNGRGFVHDNLAASAAALRELATTLRFDVDVSTNADVFTDERLATYRAVVFANSNNEAVENEGQREALQRYLDHGGGFVGIHSSAESERTWNWFQQMQGGKFLRHSPMQTFTVTVVDSRHPATAHLPSRWTWTDECYFFTNVNPGVHVLLTVDTASLKDPDLVSAPGEKVAGVFPLAWCQEVRGSRRFYTSLGHKIAHYSDPTYRQHLLGALQWVLQDRRPNHPSSTNP